MRLTYPKGERKSVRLLSIRRSWLVEIAPFGGGKAEGKWMMGGREEEAIIDLSLLVHIFASLMSFYGNETTDERTDGYF